MILFKPMTEKDLPRVFEIENSAGPHPWPLNNFRDSIESNHCCLVAELNETIIAQGIIMNVVDEAQLLILTVDADHQKKGIGKALLQQLIFQAKRHKAKTLFLEVRASNSTAFQLYIDAGFNEIGRRYNYYPADGHKSEDAITMALDIDLAIDEHFEQV